MKWLDKIENGLIVLGSAVGLANIKEIFGIILIGVQLLIIITKTIVKFVHMIKLKNINEAIAELEKAQDEIKNMLPNDEDKEEDEDGGENK